ncbi:unnamed protein product [Rhizophagus irregularis]|nr:unnamed protein product [Rhizophagus irregularis]
MEGPRWNLDEEAEVWTRNGPIKVILKRLDNSQNVSQEFVNQDDVSFVVPIFFSVIQPFIHGGVIISNNSALRRRNGERNILYQIFVQRFI